MSEKITIDAVIDASIERVWDCYNKPEHVTQWNHASDDWHSPKAENDLRPGGRFTYRMEAKDGSAGFDFTGTYTDVVEHARIAYTMEDGRKADIAFVSEGESVRVTVSFDAENENPVEMQRAGWQAILDNFKKYAEA